MSERKRAQRILQILSNEFGIPKWTGSKREPFQTLIGTVLSQATNDRNRDQAYANLVKRFEIDPKELASADVKEIEKAIRVGGLYRNKASKIKALSKTVLKEFNGSLDFIFSEPLEKARELLMSIPGVGPKTADVVLVFAANKSTIPVDTHVNRVSRRLGLAPLRGGYEDVRRSLESLYQAPDYLAIHLLLISLGRKYCRARNPLHKPCPVKALCPTVKKEAAQPSLHRLHGSRDYP
ncbi:MAG TPA: endonuclease III [Candidatus Bathyarchaeia archaeon]|nr:endonuclease III [Candidatus Bathyarchaeia archaeon]